MLKKGFKVTNKFCQSIVSDDLRDVVQYCKGKWSYPQAGCGPLCVFTQEAEPFMEKFADLLMSHGARIHPCLYEPCEKQDKRVWNFKGEVYDIGGRNDQLAAYTELAERVRI